MAIKVLWEDYFKDDNVNFPKHPSIIQGVSVYDAPYGMGVQFRGGPQQLVIQGKSSSLIYEFLKKELDGRTHINTILGEIPEELEFIEVTDVLRILHSNGLLEDRLTNNTIENEVGDYLLYQKKQLDFYKRTIGLTGFNQNVGDITHSLKGVKILLVGSGSYGDTLAGLMCNMGYKLVSHFSFDNHSNTDKQHSENYHYKYLDKNDVDSALQAIYENINDHTFVVAAIQNPSYNFLMGLNRLCLNSKINVIFTSVIQNLLRIGPFVSPKRNSCYQCFQMRMDSFQNNAVIENIYQDMLTGKNVVFDETLKGEDLVVNLLGSSYLVSELNKLASGTAVSNLINNVVEYDILEGKFSYINTLRVPFCPECSH